MAGIAWRCFSADHASFACPQYRQPDLSSPRSPSAPQRLHHDTNKPQQKATAISPAIPTVRYISHRRLLCTPPGAQSGLRLKKALWLQQAAGGARNVIVSTECNTGTLKIDARE